MPPTWRAWCIPIALSSADNFGAAFGAAFGAGLGSALAWGFSAGLPSLASAFALIASPWPLVMFPAFSDLGTSRIAARSWFLSVSGKDRFGPAKTFAGSLSRSAVGILAIGFLRS